MKKMSDILSGIPSFGGLSENQIEEIKQIVVDRHFNKGEIIFFQGDKGDGFYVVVSGMVKIFKVSLEGKEHVMISTSRLFLCFDGIDPNCCFPHVANARHYFIIFRIGIDKPLKSTTLCQDNHQKIFLRQHPRNLDENN